MALTLISSGCLLKIWLLCLLVAWVMREERLSLGDKERV
jgi:hypothetical protein